MVKLVVLIALVCFGLVSAGGFVSYGRVGGGNHHGGQIGDKVLFEKLHSIVSYQLHLDNTLKESYSNEASLILSTIFNICKPVIESARTK
ncbi:unnamed protein product [Rotaria sordida]|uniref:Uncharacterized protein n=1 Tax=Rotaria sordida TaxID=392033 RepID=A0A815LB62_9BILA|nr:unnamed protein product [Rotaria sordida]